jgi:hypothetical protein
LLVDVQNIILAERTIDQIRSLQDATPFQAFRVHMANGKSVRVPHPDFMSLSPTGRILIVYRANDSFEVIDTLLVTSIETLPKNGSARRR